MLKLMDPTIFPMPTSGLEKNTPMIPVVRPGIDIPVAMTKPPVTSWPDDNQSIRIIYIIRRLLCMYMTYYKTLYRLSQTEMERGTLCTRGRMQ